MSSMQRNNGRGRLDSDIQARKDAADAQGGADAYPYDSCLDIRTMAQIDGLDRLRYVQDRAAAAWLYELYWWAQQTERDPEYHRQKRRDEAKAAAEELEWLHNVARSSFSGAFGRQVQRECEKRIGVRGEDGKVTSFRTDEVSLRDWVRHVRTLDWQGSADATRRVTR